MIWAKYKLIKKEISMSKIIPGTTQNALSPLNTYMNRIYRLVIATNLDEVKVARPGAEATLTKLGIDTSVIPSIDALKQSDPSSRWNQVKTQVERRFTPAVKSMLSIPKKELPAAIKKEGLSYGALVLYVSESLVDVEVAHEVIKAGMASFENPEYTTPLMEQMAKLMSCMSDPMANGNEGFMVIETVFHEYTPYPIDELASEKVHFTSNDTAPIGEDDMLMLSLHIRPVIQAGVERRIFMEMFRGVAQYTVQNIEQLHEWQFISDAGYKLMKGLFTPRPTSYHEA
jgi:hypothetical protein